MHWWSDPDEPAILAGRDEQAGGTWLGVDSTGRIAAVTNYREPNPGTGRRSRGGIPVQFLHDSKEPERYAASLARNSELYSGFNALFGSAAQLWWTSNRGDSKPLKPGIHALSNHLLNTPWPKVRQLQRALGDMVAADNCDLERLFSLLDQRQVATDHELPDTGIGLEKERLLSPMFIVSPHYGTRCSTVLRYSHEKLDIAEISYNPAGQLIGSVQFKVDLP